MSDEGRRRSRDDEGRKRRADDGKEPASCAGANAYAPFILMETLMDKLKILNYDEDFCKKRGFRPISRHFFAAKGDSSEQLYIFGNLMSWLLGLCGQSFEGPQQFDDPNTVANNIMLELRKQGISGEVSQTKIKQCFGEEVCQVLNTLAQQALKRKNWKWNRPLFDDEEETDDIVEDAGQEVQAVPEDDEVEEDLVDEDDDAYIDFDSTRLGEAEGTTKAKVLESKVSAAEWKLEVERVLPHLKVHLQSDVKDWRHHLSQMKENSETINSTFDDTKTQLEKLEAEIGKTLEKIGSREKYINSQLEGLIQEYRVQQDSLTALTERYKQAHSSVSEMSRTLASLTDELETVRQQMEEKGNTMTDAAPLVKIRQSLNRLKEEIREMDLRTGVVQHVLLSFAMKEKGGMVKDMNAFPTPNMAEDGGLWGRDEE